MNINNIVLPEPPNVLKSIRTGFDAITKHLVLMLFPLGLDLILWFGPHLQIRSLVEQFILEMNEVSQMFPADFARVMQESEEIWAIAGERVNLLVALRSLPVGIFSLLTSILPIKNPLGTPVFWDVPNLSGAFTYTLLIFSVGLVMGGLYFSAVRQAAVFDEVKWGPILKDWPRVSFQSLLLSIIWAIFFLVVLMVGSCAATGMTFFSVSLGQVAIILFGIISFWLLFPLVFSPHGIYARGEKAWRSLLSSVRLTNLTFMRTSLFIMLAILVNQGLNMIWQVAPEDSWLMLISILGHAFVTTGMLSASFIYYQDINRWMEELKALGAPQPIAEERTTLDN
ncbi:MAG TPA: hypothetical protein ENG59_07095 [Chloroflexi bacterium]|nr:MAG: hypothetical protein DRI46_02385 [Chloroflexota bacterium]HDD55988.1 hypothetical protein [Chloroflexota bacterium]